MNAKIECVCPPRADGQTRHPDGDTVVLRDKLDFRQALTARNAIALAKEADPDMSSAEILAILTEVYLVQGIASWTVQDEKGKVVPTSREAIRQFIEDHLDEAMEVGDVADGLYSAAVILPLVRRGSKLSQPSPTDDSTSRTTGSQSKPPKQLKPSLISTIPTEDIGKTSSSPAGVSN